MSRESISKKVRFEVFKRDSFTCQYCGGKSPDVVLVVDHIKPVAGGGENDIMNLITACQPCNAGKGARELSDQSTLEKQRKQLEELSERREQLEMMIQWREGLSDFTDQQIAALENKFNEKTGHSLTESGRNTVRKWLKAHDLNALLDALDDSLAQYLKIDDKGAVNAESANKVFSYVARIASVKKKSVEKPYLRDLFYIRGILRARLNYVNEWAVMRLMEEAVEAGATTDSLKELSKAVRNWTSFEDEVRAFIDRQTGGGE